MNNPLTFQPGVVEPLSETSTKTTSPQVPLNESIVSSVYDPSTPPGIKTCCTPPVVKTRGTPPVLKTLCTHPVLKTRGTPPVMKNEKRTNQISCSQQEDKINEAFISKYWKKD